MTRILVDIPSEDLAKLDAIAGGYESSRAGLIRQVLKEWIKHQDQDTLENHKAFGLLKNSGIEGVSFQKKLREEWEK